jgi:hypothetical protein
VLLGSCSCRADFNRIDYADDRGVDRTLFASESHSRGAALHDQDNFVDPGPDGVDCHEMAFLILAINIHQPRDKQLAPVKAIILARRYYRSNYSSKNHNQWSVSAAMVGFLRLKHAAGVEPTNVCRQLHLPYFSRDS